MRFFFLKKEKPENYYNGSQLREKYERNGRNKKAKRFNILLLLKIDGP